MIRWDCRQCGEPLEAPDALVATTIDCPKCATPGRVPGPARGIGTRHWRRWRRIRRIGVGVFFTVIAVGWLWQATPRGKTLPEPRDPLTMLRAARLLEMDEWVFVSEGMYDAGGGIGLLRFVVYERGVGDVRLTASLNSLSDNMDALAMLVFRAHGQPDESGASKEPAAGVVALQMIRLIPDSAETIARISSQLEAARHVEGSRVRKEVTATTASGWRLTLLDYLTYSPRTEEPQVLIELTASRSTVAGW